MSPAVTVDEPDLAAPITAVQLLALLENGESVDGLVVSGADMHAQDFGGYDLSGLTFINTDLRDANFAGVRALGIQFINSTLDGSVHDRADYGPLSRRRGEIPVASRIAGGTAHGASFQRVNMRFGVITRVAMDRFNAGGGRFIDASVTHVVARDSNWSRVTFTGEGAHFCHNDVSGTGTTTDASPSSPARTTFEEANLSGLCLYGTDASGSDFTRANLTRANLCFANLNGVVATDAIMKYVQFRGGRFENAYVTRADIDGAVLTGTSTRGTNITAARNPDRAKLSFQAMPMPTQRHSVRRDGPPADRVSDAVEVLARATGVKSRELRGRIEEAAKTHRMEASRRRSWTGVIRPSVDGPSASSATGPRHYEIVKLIKVPAADGSPSVFGEILGSGRAATRAHTRGKGHVPSPGRTRTPF